MQFQPFDFAAQLLTATTASTSQEGTQGTSENE
jgi:hypothetical protein